MLPLVGIGSFTYPLTIWGFAPDLQVAHLEMPKLIHIPPTFAEKKQLSLHASFKLFL